jgi:hypothetical protein
VYAHPLAAGWVVVDAARAGLNYVTVILNDATPPADVAGSNIPTEPQHGTITINGSATDTIAGLLTLAVINSEGQPVGAPVTLGPCNYALLTPCPTRASSPLPVDTEDLPEGEDQIRVLATNAAHDQTTSPPYNLTVTNAPNGGQSNQGNENDGTKTTPNATNPTTSQQPGNTATTSTTTPANAATSTSDAPRRHLGIKLDAARLRHGRLVLEGATPANAGGLLKVTVSGHLRDGRRWKAKAQIRLANGRFKAAFRVAESSLRPQATVNVLYLGSAVYAPARLRTIVDL